MDITTAQLELRNSYLRGGPGTIISGIVWLFAGVAANNTDIPTAFAVLFFGGMLISPLSTLLRRSVFRRSPPQKGNQGGLTVIETTFPMIGGLIAAWLMLPFRPDFVFPLAAIAVGTHYFGFRTAYGDWTYWILGGALVVVGSTSIFVGVPSANIAPLLVAAVEVIFGIWLTRQSVIRDQ
ncbi:MAG: hypothetical protein FJ196_03585 [Gammaproteobacteria bacterium]|nr:hypothetical protein [Gammaproteobacteria bacterium]